MMDEKRLAQVAVQDTWHGQSRSWTLGDFTEEEACEVLRLARMGLWAEKHAIPALKTPGDVLACSCCDSSRSVQEHFDKTLAALPKEKPDASR